MVKITINVLTAKTYGIEYEYDEISLVEICEYREKFSGYSKNLDDSEKILIALKKDNKYELDKMNNSYCRATNVGTSKNYIFDKINFYHDIMVLKDQTNTYIYDYNEKLLKVLPFNTIVTEIAKYSGNCNEKRYSYNINGDCYKYKDGNLKKVIEEVENIYVATYETDTDLFEAKTLNKKEHDDFCDYIDTQEDDLAKKSLLELSNDNQALKKNYPTLVVKRKKIQSK